MAPSGRTWYDAATLPAHHPLNPINIRPEQFTAILTEVLRDEMPEQLKPLADDLADLKGTVGELAAKINSYHAHPRRIEKRLGFEHS